MSCIGYHAVCKTLLLVWFAQTPGKDPLRKCFPSSSTLGMPHYPAIYYIHMLTKLIFSDPAVQALQFLDVISMKDPSQKAQFFRTTLTQVFPFIPRVSLKVLKSNFF